MSIGIDKRVQINKIVESQLPEFVRSDFPTTIEFFKQYYLSQEFQGGSTDLITNLDQYLKVDNLVPEVVHGTTTLIAPITNSDGIISVASTKGFPDTYGLLKIGNEIITYTSKGDFEFFGCIRGFSGVSGFDVGISTSLDNVNKEGLVFESTKAESHANGATVTNLSVLFIQEFYKTLKKTFLPGLEDNDFTKDLDVGNFIKNARSFYQSKGIEESIKILLRVLYGEESIVLDLEERLLKPSSAEFLRREVIIVDKISGDPQKLVGQTIFKSNDLGTNASVSEVEILTRNEKVYYKISLFVGYSDRDLIEGIFTIPGRTKVLEPVSIGSSVVSVDSTVGFAQTGYVLCGINSITYSSKTVNQFFGCTNIIENIDIGSDLRADETIYGYEDGDLTKRVDLRITGVISDFKTVSDISLVSEGERIFVKNVGESIPNPVSDKTYKEIFANSWIYNTSSRYQVLDISGSTISLGSSIDKSSLKLGDTIEILLRNSNTVAVSLAEITDINDSNNQIVVSGLSGFTPTLGLYYDIRRKLNKATSNGIEILEGNSNIISDVLNVYTDDDKEAYVATNSLPSYTIPSEVKVSIFENTGASANFDGYDADTQDYDIIKGSSSFGQSELITGDSVVYTSSAPLTVGDQKLVSGDVYYVEVVNNIPAKIRIYRSRAMIGNGADAIRFKAEGDAITATHTFTKELEYNKKLSANKILKTFPLGQDLFVSGKRETPVNDIGMLIDGVQIRTPISNDYIYYGPIDSVDVYNGGEDYDVINPPRLVVDNSLGAGTTALVEPVITGTVKQVFVDPHDFDILDVKALSLTGGNGTGCVLEPVISQRYRELLFDSRDIFFSGGLSIADETITFKTKHFLDNGDLIYYNSNGNPAIGVGLFGDVSNTASGRLATGAGYNIRVVNSSTIQLHTSYEDAIAGINTIGISTATNAAGIHKFRTGTKKTLQSVKVINPGFGYQYRKLHVKPADVSVGYAKINFKGHGFNDGDLVEYENSGTGYWQTSLDFVYSVAPVNRVRLNVSTGVYTFTVNYIDVGTNTTGESFIVGSKRYTMGALAVNTGLSKIYEIKVEDYLNASSIGGLDPTHSYYVLKVDDDSFRLADAGSTIGGALNRTNFERRDYVAFNSQGDGFQTFKFPDIKVNAEVSFGSTVTGSFNFTPVVTGEITDLYLYEKGTKYGSDILNLQKNPKITIENGKNALVSGSIVGGKIVDVAVLNRGKEYYSLPDVSVQATGITTTNLIGNGAVLRPIIVEGRLTDVLVINPGIGYTGSKVTFTVTPRGKNAKFEPRVRKLTLDNIYRQGNYSLNSEGEDSLHLSVHGYTSNIRDSFNDDGTKHSPIIGWAYDGNPIYGPYGYSDVSKLGPTVGIVTSGYVLDSTKVLDRPSTSVFPEGFFVDDWHYDGSGTLDEHNGRFCKTDEFPNGIYAYFASLQPSQQSNILTPSFPYFIGKTFRSPFISTNTTLTQEFDFNSSNLARNTFPYKVGDELADNDFIVESNEFLRQLTTVESVTTGVIDSLSVLDGGDGYKVGDFTNFDDSGTNGSGLRGQVKTIVGIGISSIDTELIRYENAVLTWKSSSQVVARFSPFFELGDGDAVSISGLSSSIVNLTDSFKIGITTDIIGLAQSMTYQPLVTGRIDDIYVNTIPKTVSIGSSIKINDDEIVKVLNIYDVGSILRVKRYGVGIAHTYGSKLDVLNNDITIPVKTEKFISTNDDFIYFNAHQSVGVGVTEGGGISVNYTVGETTKEVSIPTRSIYLPNHPFSNGQELTFTKRGTSTSLIVGIGTTANNLFNLPDVTTDTFTVYAINKGQNYIGLVTERTSIGSTSEGLYFHSNGSDDSEYLLKSNHAQVIGDIDRITATVTTDIGAATTSTHGLSNFDVVNLNVIPNTVVGVGSTAPLSLTFNNEFQKLLVNKIGFSSTGFDAWNSKITIPDHGYKTGDRVFYETNQAPSGLTDPCYYVYEVSSNEIHLGETLKDVQSKPPRVVGFSTFDGAGTDHSLSLINPQLKVSKNSKLSFNVSDTSLTGYALKFFYDKEFKNEFISSQDSSNFNISGVGTVGVGTTSTVSIAFSKTTPTQLYYAVEKGGYISTADPLVANYSEIKFVDSAYSGEYKIFGITSDTYKVSPTKIPELLSYQADQCEIIEYSTQSKTVSGAIKDIKVISKGQNYKKIPKFENVVSLNGKNANIVALSTSIARIKDVRILDIGYEYPSDKTLSPEAFVSPVIRIDDVDSIKGINVIDGGNQYLSAPDVVVYDPQSDIVVDETSLTASTPHQSISEINIVAPIQGLKSVNHRIVTINNSNGVGISSMTGGGSGIVTCILETPINGFVNPPFATGDEIFVEGVELFGEAGIGTQTNTNSSGIATGGDGYNSANYQYRFFKVDDYTNSNPAVLKYSVAGLTTNPGIAKTYQSGYANIINRKNYPVFEVIQERGLLLVNESVLVEEGNTFIERGLVIVESREDFIKIDGNYELKIGDRIKGSNTNISATVTNIVGNRAKFVVDYSNRQDYGWSDNIGKLNEDFQVIPNNDYYQNLSYSIKSPVPWDTLVNPVNRLVHPAGLKNFTDVGITSAVNVGIGTTIQATPVIVVDLMNDKRVDTINNFDFGRDYDARPELNPIKSKFATFQNTKLTDFTKCKSNRVLIHDDISGKFSSKGFQDVFTELEEVDGNFTKYVVQITDADTLDIQLSELAVLTTTNNAILVEKYSDFTNMRLGNFEATSDAFQRKSLNFLPTEKYDRDHDIKILKTEFITNAVKNESTSIGQIDLTGVNVKVAIAQTDTNNNISGFTTTTIAQFSDSDFNGFFADVLVQDDITKEINYGEIIVDFDGTNIFYAETYVDTLNISYSASQVGVLTARYDSGSIYFECENSTKRAINVSANIVGLGATIDNNGPIGVGTYRYAVPGQPVGAERSARLESTYHTGTSTPILVSRIDKRIDSSIKSLVRVSSNTESAIHQTVVMQDDGTATTIQYPFTGQSNSGLGTIGAVTSGNNIDINFYPDPSQTDLIEVQAYSEVFNTINDFQNTPSSLLIGPTEKSLLLSAYDGVNGTRANKVNFDLKHEEVPIYTKIFNPADTTQLNKVTGEFTIPNHFYNNNEQLTYTPGSTFVGVGSTAVSIGSTTNTSGITTDILPETVFVKVTDENKFKLFSRKEYISSGIAITFTGIGEGNAHKLDMTKKLSKTVIGLDGIVQQPITFTSIEHTLDSAIGAGTSQFVLSGISSVQPRDVLKVGPEYMKIEQVGFSSLPEGTINDSTDVALGICTLPVVRVNRGSLGIAATTHTDGALARVHRGSFNIIDSTVWFLDPPKGNTRTRRNDTNLPYVRSEFSGRTFLRSNYNTNMVFDDVSDVFTGIGKTYTMTVGGANTETGVGIGNGILFINGIFQTPLTLNNAGNNYEIESDSVAGISSVVFTGISSENGTFMQSDFDINQNQLPRGGLIVSMGSTPGLGYAPLVGANVKPNLKDNINLYAAGSIDKITGIGASSKYQLGIQTAAYDNTTGIITVTTNTVHGFALGYPNTVQLQNLEFKCPTDVVGPVVTGSTAYNASTGDLTLQINNHGLSNGDAIKFKTDSLTFTCAQDPSSPKTYPRATDPAHDTYLYISDVTTNTFKVNVLRGTLPTYTGAHTFVSATSDAVETIGGGGYVGVTTSIFQDHDGALPLVGIISERTFEVQVGLTSIRHIYHGGGSVYEYYNDLTFGSGYRNPVSIGVTDIQFEHKFVSSNTNSITANTGTQYTPETVDYISSTGELILTLGDNHGLTAANVVEIANATYNPTSGAMTITAGVLTNGHGFSDGDYVKIKDNSITFTCSMDGNATNHTYPRPSDPISGKWVTISNVTQFTFDINVGASSEVTFTPTFAEYDPTTGLMEITIGTHTLKPGTSIKLDQESIKFTCDVDNNQAEKAYPRASDPFYDTAIKIESVTDNTITIQTLTTVPSTNTARHTFSSANANAVKTGGNYTHAYVPGQAAALTAITRASNTLTVGTGSLNFTCSRDDHDSIHSYPRSTDPAAGQTLGIEGVTNNTVTINVGSGGGGGTGAIISTKVATNKHKFVNSIGTHIFKGTKKWDAITIGTTKKSVSDATYDPETGVLELTIGSHSYTTSDTLTIAPKALIFTCDADDHATLHSYPRTSDPAYNTTLPITAITGTTVTVNVGSPHQKDGVTVSYGTTTASSANYDPATGELVIISNNHGVSGASTITPTNASYVKNTGNLTLTKAGHGYAIGDKILIEDYGLTFTCTKDNNQTEHRYPRPTDYASGKWLEIYASTTNTFKVNVNPSPSASQFTHTFVPAKTVSGCIQKSNANVGIVTGSLSFKCAQDAYQTVHQYPRITDPAYNTDLPVGKVTINTMRLQVGKSPAGTGGALDFTINNRGAKYVNPTIVTPEPIYENMPIVGISRLGVGKTEDTGKNLLLNLNVGAATTNVGIARSMFEISEFDIARAGYSFSVGDKFKPQGLVVDKRLQKPLQEFELEVVSTFNDFFAAWQFGELDFIDDISPMQTGNRTRFPLFRNGQLLSFEVDEESALGESIDLNAVLVIFVNGVMQTPNVAYQFSGGTTFTFTEAPSEKDKVDVFFYKGEDGVDVEIVNINETIKIGDDIHITRNPAFTDTIDQETDRIIKDILGSDLVETTLYRGVGINESTFKPLDWTKQKEDKIIKGELISKAREIIEPQIYPTAKVIGDVNTTTGNSGIGGFFVDDAESFFYEDDTNPALDTADRYNVNITAIDALLMSSSSSVAAAITATVSSKGDISGLTIVESGSGYVGSAVTLSIAAPIGVGIGTTVKNEFAQVGVSTFAEATANIVDGKVDSITIDNIGLGYTHTNPPQVIIKKPLYQTEKMTSFDNVEGYTGIITGISTAQGSGGAGTKALKFFFTSHKSNANKLAVGYPLLIKDTTIGSGVTSVDGHDNSVVAIGTHFLDNIYKVHTFTQLSDFRAEITCDILSTTNTTGFAQTGYYDITNIGLTTSLGTISWGRIYNGTRSTSPISIGVTGLTVDSGLSTYPTIQRRYYNGLNSEFGLRNTGSIRTVSGL